MTTPTAGPQTRLRQWSAGASAIAQIAATAAGMLPWWALPLTLALTAFVARPAEGPVDPARVRLTRGVGVAAVGLFAGLIAFKAVAAGSAGADPIATLRSLTEALVILSLVMAPSARTPREYRVWLTVTTGVLVAAAAGGHSASSAALSLFSWIVLLTAITQVQAAAAIVDGAVSAVAIGVPMATANPRQTRLLAAAIPVSAALLAGALVYFAMPAGLGGDGLAKKIAGQVSGNTNGETATRDTVGVDTYGDGELSLTLRGTLPDTPLIAVPASSPVLWRGMFYSTYTGHSWLAANDQPFNFVRGNSDDVPTSTSDPTASHATTRTDPVTFAPGFRGSLIWSPGVPLHVRGLGGRLAGVTRQTANVRLIGSQVLRGYQVTSAVAPTNAAILRRASGADNDDPQWTRLPSGLPSQIGQLARQITANASDRYEQVRDVETYLRAHETYTQASPVPGVNDDAVYDFLFRDHEGFCEQFASAEAVLLRTLGVPTRVVTGLAYGTTVGRNRLYNAANAHAWDEIYYPGVGWSSSDPTFGVELATDQAGRTSWLRRAVNAVAVAVPGGKTALGVVLFALIAGLAFLGRAAISSRRGSGGRRSRRTTPIGPVLTAFNRLTRHPRVPAPRAPAETAREYLSRLAPTGELDQAIAALEQECYGVIPPDPATAASAVELLTGVVDHPR